MQCRQVRKSLHRYIAGDTNRYENAIIEEHLSNCCSCRLEYERTKEIKNILTNMSTNVQAPPNLITNIMESIDFDRYKNIGIYAINNIRSLGISLIAAGIIIGLINIFPHTEQWIVNNIGRSMAKINDSIIRPIEIINNNIIDISAKITELSTLIDGDN